MLFNIALYSKIKKTKINLLAINYDVVQSIIHLMLFNIALYSKIKKTKINLLAINYDVVQSIIHLMLFNIALYSKMVAGVPNPPIYLW